MKIGDRLHKGGASAQSPEGDRLIGIEVEVENFQTSFIPEEDDFDEEPHPNVPQYNYWHVKSDDSLRNKGAELITPPLAGAALEPALDELYTEWSKHEWQATARTGIHVHVDIRDFDIPNLTPLLGTYCLLEAALFDFVGAEREECIYCVPWYRSTSDVDTYLKGLRFLEQPSGENLFALETLSNLCKYSAFFLGPALRLGTVEFRHAPTWISKDMLFTWANICKEIVLYSKDKTIEDVLTAYEEMGPEIFLSVVTRDWLPVPNNYEQLLINSDCEAIAEKFLNKNSSKWVKLMFDIEGTAPPINDFDSMFGPQPMPEPYPEGPYFSADSLESLSMSGFSNTEAQPATVTNYLAQFQSFQNAAEHPAIQEGDISPQEFVNAKVNWFSLNDNEEF